jgi:hypothetical protein
LSAGAITLPPGAVTELVHPSLGSRGGGDVQVDARDPNGLRTQMPTFEASVKLDNQSEEYYPGQRAFVRLTLDRRTLAWLWTNKFLQLIQSHDSGKWL